MRISAKTVCKKIALSKSKEIFKPVKLLWQSMHLVRISLYLLILRKLNCEILVRNRTINGMRKNHLKYP